MSTIKVNSIKNTATNDGGIAIDNSGHVQIDGQQLPSAGALSNRNLVVNGAMQVAQRATSKASITTQAYWTVDRFNVNINALGTWTMSQESSGPDGFAHSLKLLCTTADASPASADVAIILYRIEGQDLQQLAYGSSAAKQSTLSFYVKSNKTGNATLTIKQPDASNRVYSAQYTISSANTWERKTIVVPADTSGTINNDTGNGLQIEWPLNTGSDYTGGSHGGWKAADDTSRNNSNLGVGGAVNDYYEITGVQLEVGSVATPFEHRSYTDEYNRCLRYYNRLTSTGGMGLVFNGFHNQATETFHPYFFPVAMRTTPTIEYSAMTDWDYEPWDTDPVASFGVIIYRGSTKHLVLEAESVSGRAKGDVAALTIDQNGAWVAFSAEI